MTYDMHAHRELVRSSLVKLAGTPGWFDYAKAEAARLAKEDPSLHEGLQQAVEEFNPAPRRSTTTRRP